MSYKITGTKLATNDVVEADVSYDETLLEAVNRRLNKQIEVAENLLARVVDISDRMFRQPRNDNSPAVAGEAFSIGDVEMLNLSIDHLAQIQMELSTEITKLQGL